MLLQILPKYLATFGTISKHNFFVAVATFWATFLKKIATFISTSGHTVWNIKFKIKGKIILENSTLK